MVEEQRRKKSQRKLQLKSIKFNKRSYKLFYKQIRYLTEKLACALYSPIRFTISSGTTVQSERE